MWATMEIVREEEEVVVVISSPAVRWAALRHVRQLIRAVPDVWGAAWEGAAPASETRRHRRQTQRCTNVQDGAPVEEPPAPKRTLRKHDLCHPKRMMMKLNLKKKKSNMWRESAAPHGTEDQMLPSLLLTIEAVGEEGVNPKCTTDLFLSNYVSLGIFHVPTPSYRLTYAYPNQMCCVYGFHFISFSLFGMRCLGFEVAMMRKAFVLDRLKYEICFGFPLLMAPKSEKGRWKHSTEA
eukprot:gene4725-3415_t